MRTLHPFIHMHALKRTSSAIHHKSPIHTHWAENYSKGELWIKEAEMGENKESSFFHLHFALSEMKELHLLLQVTYLSLIWNKHSLCLIMTFL